jgi:hypothetical protein
MPHTFNGFLMQNTENGIITMAEEVVKLQGFMKTCVIISLA